MEKVHISWMLKPSIFLIKEDYLSRDMWFPLHVKRICFSVPSLAPCLIRKLKVFPIKSRPKTVITAVHHCAKFYVQLASTQEEGGKVTKIREELGK